MGIVPVQIDQRKRQRHQKQQQKTLGLLRAFVRKDEIRHVAQPQQHGKIFRQEGHTEQDTGQRIPGHGVLLQRLEQCDRGKERQQDQRRVGRHQHIQ